MLLVRAKLRRKHSIEGEVPVAWTGGVIEKMTQVREAFFAGLHAAAPQMPVAGKRWCRWKARYGGPGASQPAASGMPHVDGRFCLERARLQSCRKMLIIKRRALAPAGCFWGLRVAFSVFPQPV